MIYQKEYNFIADNIDNFVDDNNIIDIEGMYKSSVGAVEFWKVMVLLIETGLNPLAGVDRFVPSDWFNGLDKADFRLEFPENITNCNLTNVACGSISFANPDCKVFLNDIDCNNIALPKNYDASGAESLNYLNKINGFVEFPDSTKAISAKVVSTSQIALTMVIPARKITFSPEFFQKVKNGNSIAYKTIDHITCRVR